MSTLTSTSTTLTIMECPVCGVHYAIPESIRAHAQDNGEFTYQWYCPNGHHLGYGDSPTEKLQKRLEQERARAGRLAAERDQAQQHASAQKGRATRFRNDRDRMRARVGQGACPCCHRHFENVERHMATKHPDFKKPGDNA